MLRGTFTLATIGLGFLTADLVERLVVVPLVRLRPARRERLLLRWAHLVVAAIFRVLESIGGARVALRVRIPARPGVLLLLNHQSLMDIPLAIKCLEGAVPRIVTRRRYARGIPLVSHNLRLYDHPLVEPGRTSRADIEALAETARTSERPLLIFPEGHRTRDGAIRPFKRSGVRAILNARPWQVYVVVVDGLWKCAELKDFVRTIGSVRARAECLGPFPFPGSDGDANEFLDEIRGRMIEMLSEIRDQH